MNQERVTRLVKASGVCAGEMILVHFWGEDADLEIAHRFMIAVSSLGASPVLLQQSRTVNSRLFSAAKEGCFDERYFHLLTGFDAVLDVFAYQPVVLGHEIAPEPYQRYRRYMARLFGNLAACRRFTQIRLPTQANAAGSGLDPQDYILRMTSAYDIDYPAVRDACMEKIERFAGVDEVTVHTGRGCVLRLNLSERTWHIDAGDGDLPCGEIYIAPVEEKTQGSVFFDPLYLDGARYDGVTLQVQGGKICGGSDPEAARYFAEQPAQNRVVCELGIGMNPNVKTLCGYTVLDEKMAGTFHIAVGANDLFGGKNKAASHLDLVGYGKVEVKR